ncbi:MAG: FAD-binding protein [Verrucomicrobia bacterium]|nr:FAD-binding protein [Verrucomicrobiota bacterium]
MVLDAVILGAGPAGLAVANAMVRAGAQVKIIEPASRVGGSIRTIQEDGWLVETGPNTLQLEGPEDEALLDAYGLGAITQSADMRAAKRYLGETPPALRTLPCPRRARRRNRRSVRHPPLRRGSRRTAHGPGHLGRPRRRPGQAGDGRLLSAPPSVRTGIRIGAQRPAARAQARPQGGRLPARHAAARRRDGGADRRSQPPAPQRRHPDPARRQGLEHRLAGRRRHGRRRQRQASDRDRPALALGRPALRRNRHAPAARLGERPGAGGNRRRPRVCRHRHPASARRFRLPDSGSRAARGTRLPLSDVRPAGARARRPRPALLLHRRSAPT